MKIVWLGHKEITCAGVLVACNFIKTEILAQLFPEIFAQFLIITILKTTYCV